MNGHVVSVFPSFPEIDASICNKPSFLKNSARRSRRAASLPASGTLTMGYSMANNEWETFRDFVFGFRGMCDKVVLL